MAATLIFAACGGGATAAPSVTVAPSTAPVTSAAAPSASAAAAVPSFAPPEKTTLNIGLSTSGETSQFAEYLANQLGLYTKLGFSKVTITGLEGDGKVVQALTAGALDMGVIGVSSAISSVPTDTPLKVVSLNGVILTDGLVCGPNYKTAADIKGKQIAISTFGGTSNGSVLILLSQLGLTASDVVITQVGSQDARVAAVKAGSVACAPVDLSQADAMTAAGLVTLTAESATGPQWGRSGLAATAAFAKANPNTVLDVMAAVLAAQNSMWTDPATAATNFATYAQVAPADATSLINAFTPIGDRAMDWTDDAFNFPKQTLATINPAISSVDITQAYDKSYLQKLYDMGYYAQINDPLKPFSK
jgi:ABC-type nitrate/sulfonate/bicarbonate transport system substrate-binding protein